MSYRLRGHRQTADKQAAFRPLLAACLGIASLIASLSFGIVQAVSGILTPTAPPLMITGLQTGGCVANGMACTEAPAMEYIEIYNPAATSLQASGWKVRYISASGGTTAELATISGALAAHSYTLLAHTGYFAGAADLSFGSAGDTGKLAKSGGHVEIVDSSNQGVDRLGWGTASQPQVKAASAPAAGQALQRRADDQGQLVYTANNALDFALADMPAPQSGGFTAAEPEAPAPTAPDPTTPAPPNSPTDQTPAQTSAPAAASLTCEGAVISELLPNPSGSDSGHEFIELYNPTSEVIALDGCSLQSSASTTKTFAFNQTSLQPGEYRSFNDAATGISLPNSAGGTVWLLSPSDELQAVSYPGGIEDDAAWTLTDGTWAVSYSPTPGAANIATPVKPCDDPGQVRNPDTGRCAAPTAAPDGAAAAVTGSGSGQASGLTPCKPGQERNPDTNRCRAIANAAAGAALTACKPGQERNPETNRCKAAASATGALAACPAGQSRNPDTNRCRKDTTAATNGSGSISDVKDVAGAASATRHKPYWLLAAAIGIAIIGYAVYEWRQEIGLFFSRLAGKAPAAATAVTSNR